MDRQELIKQARELVHEWNPGYHLYEPMSLVPMPHNDETGDADFGQYSPFTKTIEFNDAVSHPAVLAFLWVHESLHGNQDAAGLLNSNFRTSLETEAFTVDNLFQRWYTQNHTEKPTGLGADMFEVETDLFSQYGIVPSEAIAPDYSIPAFLRPLLA